MRTALVAVTLLLAMNMSAGQPTTVLLVRHAEAVQGGDDPPLTDIGAARAKALVAVGENAGVDVVITSHLRRTKDTAAPLVDAKKIPTVAVPIESGKAAEQVAEIVKRIKTEYAGKTVLVVGHNNTIPMLVNALSGTTHYETIPHADNSRLFVVVLGETPRVIASQYGCQ